MLRFTISLQVILTTGEVPHEVSPVHEVTLVSNEEPDIVYLRRHLYHHLLATTVVRHFRAVNTVHPLLVGTGMTTVVHTWEQHVLSVFVLVFRLHNKVFVLLVRRRLLLALINGVTLINNGTAHIAFDLQLYLRCIGRAIEQRTRTILFATHVFAQGKEVLRGVLVHWRVGCRTNDNHCIRRVTDNQHQHTKQRRIFEAGADQ